MRIRSDDKTCINCKHFSRYYVLNASLRFAPTNKGFCGSGKVPDGAVKKYIRQNVACDMWQPRELKKLKEHYGIELKLQIVKEQLDDIIALLRDVE